jgi:uncharacterized membrane protein
VTERAGGNSPASTPDEIRLPRAVGNGAESSARSVRGGDGGSDAAPTDQAGSGNSAAHHGGVARRWQDAERDGSQRESLDGPIQQPLIPLHDIPHTRGREMSLPVGPLPPPEDLARYGELSPDLVDRIVTMAETDLNARAGAMTTSARAEAFAVRSGALVSAVVVPITFIFLAVTLAMNGANDALVVIVGAMAPLLFGLAKIVSALRSASNDEP